MLTWYQITSLNLGYLHKLKITKGDEDTMMRSMRVIRRMGKGIRRMMRNIRRTF